ncbi:MAG TPA: hypothetical protein VJH92_04315 [Candidatus Nanoarchaeia archaeon]|nr:hypothetical protein [Candidatus Nanoarchaeia archaeon]
MKKLEKEIIGPRSFREAEENLRKFYETLELVRRYSQRPVSKILREGQWGIAKDYSIEYI